MKLALPDVSRRLVRDDLRDVSPTVAWADAEVATFGLAEDLRNRLGVCLEEALVNLIVHGQARGDGKAIVVTLDVDASGATVWIEDSCEPFDVAREKPPAAPTREDMHEGGMGLRLLRAFATSLSYASTAGRNTLTLVLRTPDASAPG